MMVSIVIPAFNAEAFIAETLESAIDQGASGRVEVILVDDGSTDGTAERARSFAPGVSVISQENRGESSARNRGIAESSGDVIVLLDADDRLAAGMVTRVVEAFTARPDVGVVYGGIRFSGEGRGTRSTDTSRIDEQGSALGSIVRGRTLIPGQFAVRRDVMTSVGGFREDMQLGEDWEFMLRLAREARFARVDAVFLEKRVHAGMQSLGDERPDIVEQRLAILRDVFRDDAAELIRRHLSRRVVADWFRSHAFSYAETGRWSDARRYVFKSLGKWPLQPALYVWLLRGTLGRGRQ